MDSMGTTLFHHICMYCHKYLKRSNNHVELHCLNKKKLVVSEYGRTGRTFDCSCNANCNNGVGSNDYYHTQVPLSEACLQLYCRTYSYICNIHKWGPYNNMLDKKVMQFIGPPLLCISPEQKGGPTLNVATVSGSLSGHQESRPPNSWESGNHVARKVVY